jgi:curli production assembly/transport component CsgF
MNLIVSRGARRAAAAASAFYLFAVASPAAAQELAHEFINPSFGGNPFNSDHLLGIAGLDRPEKPEDSEPAPTPEELLVSQLEAQLNSTLSSNILRAIQTATPGQTGEFLLGVTRINFVRTATETRVTFTNTTTGETREIVLPVNPTGPFGLSGATALSAERVLSISGGQRPTSSSQSAATQANGARRNLGEFGILSSPPPL